MILLETMKFELNEWASFPRVGKGYAADLAGKWCSFLETKKGAYRGNHVHQYDQYTVLLAGKAIVVKNIDGKLIEYPIELNKVHLTPKGIQHILIPLEDSILYEWWDGPFESTPCPGVFEKYVKDRVGPGD